MKIPLIDDVHRLFRFYSVWVLLAILLVSIGEALLAFYIPTDAPHAIASGIATGVLAIAGILLRTIKQEPRRGKSAK